MHDDPVSLPLKDRVNHWLTALGHVLPGQAPIQAFVHHNTLHGYQHLPFAEALRTVHDLTGAYPYWPDETFREAFSSGRITPEDLENALTQAGPDNPGQMLVAGLTRRQIWLASLLAGQPASQSGHRWAQREGLLDTALLDQCAALLDTPPHPVDWQTISTGDCHALFGRLGHQLTFGQLLEHLTGEPVTERIRSMLQRHLAAHLDLGMAPWQNPLHDSGLYHAWRASARIDFFWDLDELPGAHNDIEGLPEVALDALEETLRQLVPDEQHWFGYVQRLALELPGWSGMLLRRSRHPVSNQDTPDSPLDYLTIRLVLERLVCAEITRRLTGRPLSAEDLRDWFLQRPAEFILRDKLARGTLSEPLQHATRHLMATSPGADDAEWEKLATQLEGEAEYDPQDALTLMALLSALPEGRERVSRLTPPEARELLGEAERLSALQRSHLWLLAYEHHYRKQLFSALLANRGRTSLPTEPSAQVVFCMDDREEGTRRHLEEIAPDIVTYGAAGFFGIAMNWQGLDDYQPAAQCPVVVTPQHTVREVPEPAQFTAAIHHAGRRARRLAWRERLHQATRLDPVRGPLLSALAAPFSLLGLTAGSLAPVWFGSAQTRWRQAFDGTVATRLQLTATDRPVDAPPPHAGFTLPEQVDRIESFLRTLGLTGQFAPLVLMLGHGSESRNNPHRSAYDCGACAGRHGGPNARVFAAMANRPEVRQGLAERGIRIPPDTWFVAAQHNTCDDSLEWYDLSLIPPDRQSDLDQLMSRLAAATRAHAAERCRRFVSAPAAPTPWQAFDHVRGRARDIGQARPELGHATNAAAVIGRRHLTRGLFLDRRVFLISYDPTHDPDERIVENILLAAGPVGAGINLEYYFSTVNNNAFGCGSKVTHNLTGRLGVMEGTDSDLRTGLPWQMVEIHEPMRLLVVVEQETEHLDRILARQPALQELIGNGWILLAAFSPSAASLHEFIPGTGWQAWRGGMPLPQIARSHDWFAGEHEALPPALLTGGRP